VITFLRRIGATTTVLELESRLVSRSLRGELNRAINAETANLLRSVIAGSRQLAAIDDAEAAGALAREPVPVRAVAAARREAPEATYAELAARTGLTRSAVQRSLVRVEALAEQWSAIGRPPR
jgi:DNA-binding protein WhiA